MTQRGSAERRSPLPFAQFGSRTEEMTESMSRRGGSMSLPDTTVGRQGGAYTSVSYRHGFFLCDSIYRMNCRFQLRIS